MDKNEIKEKLNNLLKTIGIERVSFLDTDEPTFLKVYLGTNNFDNDEILRKKIEESDFYKLGKWKIVYLGKTKDFSENPDYRNYFVVDMLSGEYLEGWKRAMADFINYKKEEAERTSNLIKLNNRSIIGEFITILDSFDLALNSVEDEKTKSGIILIKNQLYDLLRKYGLERLDGGVGKIFNPETDEVIELREDDLEEGKIIKVLTPGYKFYDKILRPARVIVSKGKGQK